jgi:N6-L-threonylcarbamoyladenine synthase
VKYLLRDLGNVTDDVRAHIAADFEEAVVEVICAKTERALALHTAHTFLLGGGVAANTYIRTRLATLFEKHNSTPSLRLPAKGLSTDNAVMIGMAGYLCQVRNVPTHPAKEILRADGNLPIDSTT